MSENETHSDGPRRRRRRRSNKNARNNQRNQSPRGNDQRNQGQRSQDHRNQGSQGNQGNQSNQSQGGRPKPGAPKPGSNPASSSGNGSSNNSTNSSGGQSSNNSGGNSGNRGGRNNRRGGGGSGNSSRNNSRGGNRNSRSSSRGNSRGSRNSRGGNRRPQSSQYRRNSTRNVSQFNQQHSELPVSVETSAGGLVISGLAESVGPDGNVDFSRIYVALIGRLDRRGRLLWSMPKGHVEPDESRHATAEREVWEETGIAGTVIADLGTIDYWFVSEGVRIHKTVHHHLLRYEDGNLNDEDPEVTEVTWLPVEQLVERLAYADERRLARQAYEQLPDFARAEAKAGRSTPR